MKKLTAFQTHKTWLLRAVSVLLVTGLAELAVVEFVERPIVWVILVSSTLPFTLLNFVAFPVLREEQRKG